MRIVKFMLYAGGVVYALELAALTLGWEPSPYLIAHAALTGAAAAAALGRRRLGSWVPHRRIQPSR